MGKVCQWKKMHERNVKDWEEEVEGKSSIE